MNTTKTFNSYNFVTGAVDGTLAYDFGSPQAMPQQQTYQEAYEDIYEAPRRQSVPQEQNWIKEDSEVKTQAHVHAHHRSGLGVLPVLGAVCAAVLVVMVLLAQIQLVSISGTAVELEAQIEELKTQRDKLTVEYETVFNLKDVEEYATGVLGMQEPREDQIYYLTNVTSGDKAVVITDETTNMFSLGLEDIAGSLENYLSGIFS
jgi:cell division protein FtsL